MPNLTFPTCLSFLLGVIDCRLDTGILHLLSNKNEPQPHESLHSKHLCRTFMESQECHYTENFLAVLFLKRYTIKCLDEIKLLLFKIEKNTLYIHFKVEISSNN